MTGIGLIFLILALIAIFSGLYFAAWCLCSVQRNPKEGHYLVNSEFDQDPDHEMDEKKFYPTLDMVDEAKSSYVKNTLDLDSINENKSILDTEGGDQHDPSAPEEKNQDSTLAD